MATEVVHVNDVDLSDPNVVYIGRAVPRRGIKASIYANPFVIGKDGTRDEVIAKFDDWARNSDDPRAVRIRANVHDLAEAEKVACWCAPLNCHGFPLLVMAHEKARFLKGIRNGR